MIAGRCPRARPTPRCNGNIAVAGNAWRPAPSNYAYKRKPLVKAPSKATLPAGYSIENYYPPKDNYGRDQLFEALGLVGDEGRHRRRRHAQRRALAHREWRVAAVRRRAVRQPRRRRRRRQGPRRRRRPEGRAHAHLRYQRRWHRRQIRNAVRRAFVSRQLPQLHARPRAWQRWVLLLRAQPRARRRRHRVHGRRQRHGHLGRLQRLGHSRGAHRQVRVVLRTACAAPRAWA